MAYKPKNNPMSVSEAGRKGGNATKKLTETGELPEDYYSRIGKQGGEKVADLFRDGKLTNPKRKKAEGSADE